MSFNYCVANCRQRLPILRRCHEQWGRTRTAWILCKDSCYLGMHNGNRSCWTCNLISPETTARLVHALLHVISMLYCVVLIYTVHIISFLEFMLPTWRQPVVVGFFCARPCLPSVEDDCKSWAKSAHMVSTHYPRFLIINVSFNGSHLLCL